METYREKGLTDMSARVDITLIDGNKKRCAHLEFKAHNCTVKNIRKDLEKLLREKSIGEWFHTLENADRRTMQSLIRKFRAALGSLSKHLDTCGSSFLIAICVLRRGSLQLKWLNFTGNMEKNQAVVNEALENKARRRALGNSRSGCRRLKAPVRRTACRKRSARGLFCTGTAYRQPYARASFCPGRQLQN